MWRRCSCFKALEAAVLVSSVESSRCALPRPKIAKPSRCACAGELHNFDPVLRVDLEQAGRCQGWEVHTVASNLGVRTHSACKQQAMLLAHIWAWKVAGSKACTSRCSKERLPEVRRLQVQVWVPWVKKGAFTDD